VASASAVVGAEPSPTATEVATPQATDEQRIAAALDQLAADVAGDEPISPSLDSLIAYDVLDTTVNPETGDVTITICGWPEGTVFDTVRDSLYSIKTNPDGTLTATHITSPTGPGDCLNTELINTALDTIDEYEVFWRSVLADPASFQSDSRSVSLLESGLLGRTSVLVDSWIRDDIYFEPAFTSADIRTDSAAELLIRRYTTEEQEILEIVSCRTMNPASGTYRAGALLDNEKGEDPGPHAVNAYQVVLGSNVESSWAIAGTPALVWADCFRDGWETSANSWRPRPEILVPIEER